MIRESDLGPIPLDATPVWRCRARQPGKLAGAARPRIASHVVDDDRQMNQGRPRLSGATVFDPSGDAPWQRRVLSGIGEPIPTSTFTPTPTSSILVGFRRTSSR